MESGARQLIVKRGATTREFTMDAPCSGSQAAKSVVGSFFECLAAYFLGAEPWSGDSFDVKQVEDAQWGGPFDLKPDMFWREQTALVEVKGGRWGYWLHVHSDQLAAYEAVRDRASWPLYRPRVVYALFGYELPKTCKRYRKVGDLLKALVAGVRCGAYLDVQLVSHLAREKGTTPGYESRLEQQLGAYKPIARITPGDVQSIARDPRAWLDEREVGGEWTVRRFDTGDGGRRRQCPLPVPTIAGLLKSFPLVGVLKKRPRRPFVGVVPSFEEDSLGYDEWGYVDRIGEHDDVRYVPPALDAEIPF